MATDQCRVDGNVSAQTKEMDFSGVNEELLQEAKNLCVLSVIRFGLPILLAGEQSRVDCNPLIVCSVDRIQGCHPPYWHS